MNELGKLFEKYGSDKGSSKHGYHHLYFKYLNKLKKENINMLEIGIAYGASLKSWLAFFPNGNIYGLDNFGNNKNIMEDVKKDLSSYDRLKIIIDSQISDKALEELYKIDFDFIIDDASHIFEHHQYTFSKLCRSIKSNGFYFIEDLQCKRNHDLNFEILAEKTYLVLERFKNTGVYSSNISSDEDNKFITDNFKVVDINDKKSLCVLKRIR